MIISSEIIGIAQKYGITIEYDFINCEKNSGASIGDAIYLGCFDSQKIEIIACFHEIGHCLIHKKWIKRGVTLSKITQESLAWELGMEIAFEYGYVYDFYSDELVWARQQLATYNKPEYF
jgi:hypothetical protein